jgi:hypothetical protein
MTFDGEIGEALYEDLMAHFGHNVVIAVYGNDENVAVECEDCSVVLVDVNQPED